MKDSKIAAELADYLRTIMPSTPSAVIDVNGRKGVRIALVGNTTCEVHLSRGFWISHPRQTVRVPYTETYPSVTIYFAYMVCGAMAHAAFAQPLDPLDQASLHRLIELREAAEARLSEARGYLHQVVTDSRTLPDIRSQAQRHLDRVGEYIAELQDAGGRR